MTIVGWQELFTRIQYQEIIIKNLIFCMDNKGLQIFSYVVMPNHIHVLASSNKNKLGDIVRDFKSYSARQLLLEIRENEQLSRRSRLQNSFSYYAGKNNSNNQIWTNQNAPKICDRPGMASQFQQYIEMNPVKAGFVEEPHYWRLSSANENSPIPVLSL